MSHSSIARARTALCRLLKQRPAENGGDSTKLHRDVKRHIQQKKTNRNEGTKKYPRSIERKMWNRQLILSAITLIIAALAGWFAWGTWCQSRRQAKYALLSLIEDHRAWVDVTADTSTASLVWDKQNGPTFFVTTKITNMGESPALNAEGIPSLIFQESETVGEKRNRMAGICQHGSALDGNTLFQKEPDNSIITPTSVSITWDRVKEFRKQLRLGTIQSPKRSRLPGSRSYSVPSTE